jgi:hypothetical protein
MQNGFVESFNGRDECLNERLFTIYRHARNSIEEWRIDYNVNRPHTSLDGLTPSEFATRSRSDHNANRLSYRFRQIGRARQILQSSAKALDATLSEPHRVRGASYVSLTSCPENQQQANLVDQNGRPT